MIGFSAIAIDLVAAIGCAGAGGELGQRAEFEMTA
jgi:hypothetical protein